MRRSAQDWYEIRDELVGGFIFRLRDGAIVKLDRLVPGDGTKWYVADWCNGSWSYEDSTIEPGDLDELLNEAELPRSALAQSEEK